MPNWRFAAEKKRRVALITGGARGIGGATTVRAAEEGRDVVIADIFPEEAAETVAKIKGLGQKAVYVETDEAAVQDCVAQTVDAFGRRRFLNSL